MEIVYLLLGIAIGAALVWIILRSKSATKLAVATEKTNSALHELVSLKSDLNQKQEEILQLNNSLTASRTDLKNLETKLREQKEELVKLRETFNLEFKNLANEILEEKTKKFTEQNKNHLDEILKPFSEKIKDFEKRLKKLMTKKPSSVSH
jgi:DNA recombination protein RmuC